MGVLVLNQCWLLTSVAILLTFTSIALWMCLTCDLFQGVVVPHFVLLILLMILFAYLIERQMK
jgi:hypothetical protein